ncbi:MAG: hypothetical protein ACRAVC_13500 [Trichormus sp.]
MNRDASSSPTQHCHVDLAGVQGAESNAVLGFAQVEQLRRRKGENLSPLLPAPCPEACHHAKLSWQTTTVRSHPCSLAIGAN